MSVTRIFPHASQNTKFGAVVSWQMRQYEFMRIMGSPGVGNTIKTIVPEAQLELCWNLINEEAGVELFTAIQKFRLEQSLENRVEIADACIDTIYVVLQLMNTLGLPAEALFDEVHRSNMAKADKDGNVRRREDGKVLKPEGWTPPQLWNVCFAEVQRVDDLTMLPACTKAGD